LREKGAGGAQVLRISCAIIADCAFSNAKHFGGCPLTHAAINQRPCGLLSLGDSEAKCLWRNQTLLDAIIEKALGVEHVIAKQAVCGGGGGKDCRFLCIADTHSNSSRTAFL
jgi:hypothetical protein